MRIPCEVFSKVLERLLTMAIKGKNIGIDARFMLRPLRGIPLYVTRLCEHIPAIAKDYTFYFFINKGFEHNDSAENYMLRLEGIQSKNENVRIINVDDDAEIRWEQMYLPRLVKEHKIDLLHMPANRICFFPGAPTVVTVHDIMEYLYLLDKKYPLSWEKNKSIKSILYNLRHRIYVALSYKYRINNAVNIITVSRYSKDDMENNLSIDSGKVKVIYHGVDEEYFEKPSLPFDDRSHVLLLGGDSFQKNPETAIAAWSKVNPELRNKFPLKVVGFCGSTSSPILCAIKKYGLQDEIDIKGWISQEDMVEYFHRSVLFIFPSRYEGFGFPLIQAMATGVPVISTSKTSIPEVLGGVGFQLDPDDINGFAESIERVLTHRSVWQKQSDTGLTRSKLFTWENSAKSHFEQYLRWL